MFISDEKCYGISWRFKKTLVAHQFLITKVYFRKCLINLQYRSAFANILFNRRGTLNVFNGFHVDKGKETNNTKPGSQHSIYNHRNKGVSNVFDHLNGLLKRSNIKLSKSFFK